MLTDKSGRKLETGFYVAPATYTGIFSYDIYYIDISERGESFTVENWEGFLPITNFEEAAKNFIPLTQPDINSRFLAGKLEKLSKH